MNFEFLLQSSPWLLLICLLVGAIYAYVLYQKNNSWTKKINYALAALRFISVSIISALLLNFSIKQSTQNIQKRKITIAIDNSLSMNSNGKIFLKEAISKLFQLKEILAEKDCETSFASLNNPNFQNPDSILFNAKKTNISSLLTEIKTNSEDENLTDVILFTDGIVNEGINPQGKDFNFRIHSIGTGDTITKKDIQITAIHHNKIAYLGNDFPIEADIRSVGFSGKSTAVYLKNEGKIIAKKTIIFKQNDDFQTVNFLTKATKIGLQHFTIELESLPQEFSKNNNNKDVYVDIVDGKEKILLLASAPHPDIKALKSCIEKNENFSLDIQILNTSTNNDFLAKKYNIVILHQLPDISNAYNSQIKSILEKKTPVFYILGNRSTTQFNNKLVQINSHSNQNDLVLGSYNPDFKALNLNTESLKILDKFSPLSAPYGNYTTAPKTTTLLYQKIGKTITNKPLLVLGNESPKSALLAGEGIWQWRMEEYQLTEKNEIVDELITKTLQYLSSKDDKRKLRVYPINNEYNVGDAVVFENEIYNDIYEKISEIPVQLTITNEKNQSKTYNYTPNPAQSKFEISSLNNGLYRYKATAKINRKTEIATGEFAIKDLQLETQNLTADHLSLRKLSNDSKGEFYKKIDPNTLANDILSNKTPNKIDITEELKDPVNLGWLLAFLLFLLSLEWGLRKYFGGV
ncbi:MAG: VWA domain-containing protein [Pseudarcicella sp.]|nr:VWA domain-containing protein [Pseudarcicella sp.]